MLFSALGPRNSVINSLFAATSDIETKEPLLRVPIMTDWSQIVQQHGPLVWHTLHRLLTNEADEADCFQATFVAALELSRTEAIRNWPALLRHLATIRALECLRQRGRQANHQRRLPEDGLVDDRAVNPLQAAESGELAEHLRQALAELDIRQAQVFCLACLEDLSYQEIARHLGVTVNHVGVLLNRARTALRERLRAHRPAPAPEGFGKEGQR
jgi:RNA polymerase sigma-70 factor (ECF subfamily)